MTSRMVLHSNNVILGDKEEFAPSGRAFVLRGEATAAGIPSVWSRARVEMVSPSFAFTRYFDPGK